MIECIFASLRRAADTAGQPVQASSIRLCKQIKSLRPLCLAFSLGTEGSQIDSAPDKHCHVQTSAPLFKCKRSTCIGM